MMKKLVILLSLWSCMMFSYGQASDSILVNIVQPNIFIVKDQWLQQINFDLSVENKTFETVELIRIKLIIFDKDKNIIKVKELYKGSMSPSISTIPERHIHKNKKLTIFNPFTVFKPYVDLYEMSYSLSFVGTSGKKYTAAIHVNPQLYISKTKLFLPLKGRAFIIDGNDLYSNHRRFDINNPIASDLLNIKTTPGIFALDFSVIDSLGNNYLGDTDQNSSYYIYGNKIFAPAKGKVVKAIDHFPDNQPGKLSFNIKDAQKDRDLLSGNCIVIDHLNGEYSFFVHLKKGSVQVKEGELVDKGQYIGQVGNSGSSMFPHLHYQLTDKAKYIDSNGLPIYFHDYNLIVGNKEVKVKKGYINTGDIIENHK